MHVVTLRIKVPMDKRKEILDAVRLVAGPTQVQPGCISCRFYQDVDDPDTVFLVEEWKTRKELDCHLKSDRYRIILSLVDMSEKPPEFKIRTISKTEGFEALEAVRGKS
jgi:quinol monooxygenase YgiN